MPKIKNATGEDRILPWLGDRLVLAGQVVEVPDDEVFAYTQQEGWEPADDAAQGIHDDAEQVDEKVADALASDEPPAANASRDDWAAYATAKGVDPGDLTRNEIREHFKEQA